MSLRYLHRLVLTTILSTAFGLIWANPADTISLDSAMYYVDIARGKNDPIALTEALRELSEEYITETGDTVGALNALAESMQYCAAVGDSVMRCDIAIDRAIILAGSGAYNEAINLLTEAADVYGYAGMINEQAIALNFTADVFLIAEKISQGETQVVAVHDMEDLGSLPRQLNVNSLTAMNRRGRAIKKPDKPDTVVVEVPDYLRDSSYVGLLELNAAIYNETRGNDEVADYYFKKAIRNTQDGVILRDALYNLSQLHANAGNYGLAFTYLKDYSAVNDSLLSARRQSIVNRLLIRLNSYTDKATINELQNERDIDAIKYRMGRVGLISLFVASLIILIGTYLAIRNYQNRLNTNEIISAQNEAINQQKINELENNLKIETMHSMINGQEAERERVAKELHDSLGGLLSTVKLHFDAVQGGNEQVAEMKEYKKAYNLLDHACNEVRNIANNMQPEALLAMGLVPALNDLVNRVQSDETPTIDFQHFDVNNDLEPTAALNIYRMVQELLNNSLKHAKASHILIQLQQKDDDLMITVEDDGVGFEPENVKRGMGTGNIESRVNFLKGDINVLSGKGEGTSTLITIPVG